MISSETKKNSANIPVNSQIKPKVSPRSYFRGHTIKDIPQQANDVISGLVKTKKMAVEIMDVATGIESEGRTTNHVFAIGAKNAPVGFLKIGEMGCNASAIMERLIWEISSIFDVQDLFSPTIEMEIKNSNARKLSVEVQEVNIFQQKKYKRYSLDAISHAPKLKGSFQITEKGEHLIDFIDSAKPLTSLNNNETGVMNNLLKAVITSLCFGMMDAHSKNIFINNDAKYKFIDNTRCFPHSNSLYARKGSIVLSYRCGLLQLNECHQKLTVSQKKYMIELIGKFKNNLPQFENFLNKEELKKRIAELPTGWFNVDMVINATRDRVEKLYGAALSDSVNTLVDLVCETVPYYRLFSIFYLLHRGHTKIVNDNYQWRQATAGASLIPLSDAIFLCEKYSINPYTLLGLSMQPNFSFPSFHEELVSLIERDDDDIRTETMFNFASQFFRIAKLDLKDVLSSEINESIRLYIDDSLIVEKIPEDKKNETLSYFVETDTDPYRLIINLPDMRCKIYLLDIYSFPGRVKVLEFPDLQPMKIPDFKNWIEKQITLLNE